MGTETEHHTEDGADLIPCISEDGGCCCVMLATQWCKVGIEGG